MYDVGAIVREPLLLEPLRRSVVDAAPTLYLRSLKIKLTARCNLKCVMCRYGKGLVLPELDTGTWLRVLDEAAGFGCRKVHFSGGEVLIRRDFEALVARAASANMKVTLTSNLTLFTKDRGRSLLSHKLSGISTSLDGATAKVHDSIRGIPGSFKRTVRALEFLSQKRVGGRPRLRINFVMMRENYRDYPELLTLAGELGACNVVPMPVDSKRASLRLSKRLMRHYAEEIAPRVLQLRAQLGMPTDDGYVYPFGRDTSDYALSSGGNYAGTYYEHKLCYAPYLHAFIAWDGNVYLCCMTNGRIESLGNVSQTHLRDIFQGERYQAIRAQMRLERLPTCHLCDMMLADNRLLDGALGSPTSPGWRPLAAGVHARLRVIV